MYSEKDMAEIKGRIHKNWLVLAPILALLLAAYIYGLSARVQWVSMAAGPLLFVAACFGFLAFLWPNLRYKGFLQDMQMGLSRDVRGTILEIGQTPQPQDGAMVLPVRLALAEEEVAGREEMRASVMAERLGVGKTEDDRNERILYLNASKRDAMPAAGAKVRLHCYGRHIMRVEREA